MNLQWKDASIVCCRVVGELVRIIICYKAHNRCNSPFEMSMEDLHSGVSRCRFVNEFEQATRSGWREPL